jgi:hypothetical protein
VQYHPNPLLCSTLYIDEPTILDSHGSSPSQYSNWDGDDEDEDDENQGS